MKKLLLLSTIAFSNLIFAQSNTLYINFGSHNETTDGAAPNFVNYNNQTTYDSVKARVSHVLDTIVHYGAKYNMQVESNFILACMNWDNAVSSNNDFIQFMEEHPNAEVDPHNHLDLDAGTGYNPYNYADLDSLLRSCGIDTATIVGGFIYKATDWTYMASENWPTWKSTGLTGNTFTNVNWKPRALWGGGTAGHVNDPFSMGVWHPAAPTQANFFNNNTSNLYCIGNGCEWVIQDTTNVTRLFQDFTDHINYLQSLTPTANSFYTGTIMFNFRHILKPQYLDSISKMIRLVDAYEASGKIAWKSLDEKLDYWEQLHSNVNDYFVVQCANLPVGLENQYSLFEGGMIEIFPNPASDVLFISNNNSIELQMKIQDINGKVVMEQNIKDNTENLKINIQDLDDGVYFLYIKNQNNNITKKLVISH